MTAGAKGMTVSGIEDFKAALKLCGMKATPQRLAVHQAMMALEHACADTVAGFIADNLGTGISVASVYNILTGLTEKGLYTRRLSEDNRMWFDVCPRNHLHLYDCVSREFSNIPDNGLMNVVESAIRHRRFRGYKIDHVEVQVVCRPTKRR